MGSGVSINERLMAHDCYLCNASSKTNFSEPGICLKKLSYFRVMGVFTTLLSSNNVEMKSYKQICKMHKCMVVHVQAYYCFLGDASEASSCLWNSCSCHGFCSSSSWSWSSSRGEVVQFLLVCVLCLIIHIFTICSHASFSPLQTCMLQTMLCPSSECTEVTSWTCQVSIPTKTWLCSAHWTRGVL